MRRLIFDNLVSSGHFRSMVALFVVMNMLIIFDPSMRYSSSSEEIRPPRSMTNIELAERYEAVLRVFRGMAKLDWQTALDVMALPEVQSQWKKQCLDLFSNPDESAAFFSHSFLLVSGQDLERWTGGIYNLWMDYWLLLNFVWQKDLREYRLAGFSWVQGSDHVFELSGITDAAVIESRLSNRFGRSLSIGFSKAKMLMSSGIAGREIHSAVSARTVSTRLQAYIYHMTRAFSPDSKEKQATLRTEVMNLIQEVKQDAIKQDALTQSVLKMEWRDALFPVYVTGKGDRLIVVLSSSQDPYGMLISEFVTTGGKFMIRRLKTLNLREHKEVRP